MKTETKKAQENKKKREHLPPRHPSLVKKLDSCNHTKDERSNRRFFATIPDQTILL